MPDDYGGQHGETGFVCFVLEVTYKEIARLAAEKNMTVPEYVTRAVLAYSGQEPQEDTR